MCGSMVDTPGSIPTTEKNKIHVSTFSSMATYCNVVKDTPACFSQLLKRYRQRPYLIRGTLLFLLALSWNGLALRQRPFL